MARRSKEAEGANPSMMSLIEREVLKERATRRRLRPVYRYYLKYGRERPPQEFWCEYCTGWFGVPHGHRSMAVIECHNAHKAMAGKRDCACIVCVVAEREAGKRRELDAQLKRRQEEARLADDEWRRNVCLR